MAVDRRALENALANDCPPLDRVRFLALLNRESEALREGFGLLPGFPARSDLLLLALVPE